MKKVKFTLMVGGAFALGYGISSGAHLEKYVFAPTVSVVLPVHNAGESLSKTMDSILASTLKDFEFIIVNDASTDNTVQILEQYDDWRIRVITNETEQGLPKALNQGFAQARGKYIIRTDALDVSYNDRLERQVAFMDKNKLDLSVGALNVRENPRDLTDDWDENIETLPIRLFQGKVYAPTTVAFRRSFWKDNKLQFEKPYEQGGDYQVWSNAFLSGAKMSMLTGAVIGQRARAGKLNDFHNAPVVKEMQTKLLAYLSPALTPDVLELSECNLLEKLIDANAHRGLLEQEVLKTKEERNCRHKHVKGSYHVKSLYWTDLLIPTEKN